MNQRKYTPDETGKKIENFLTPVLRKARLKLNFDVVEGDASNTDFETPDLIVKFSGPDVDALLENKAELLLSFEQLTMEVLRMPPEDHSRLCFDANDYRMLRIEELRLSALTAAERVKKSGMPFRFNPMNSRERRIIHIALRNESAVRSESAGLGPQRQVIIYPAGMPTPPEAAHAAAAPAGGPPRGGRRRR